MKKSLNFQEANQLHQQGQLDEAKKAYLILLQKNPKNTELLHALGILCMQQDKINEGINYLETAVKINPQDTKLHLHLANALKMGGLYAQAEQTLNSILQQYPNYTAALNNLGTVYYLQEKYILAENCFRNVIAKMPEYIDAYYNLGLTLTKQNHFEEAIQNYEELLKLSPDHFAARFQLACVLMQQEKTIDAINIFLTIEKTYTHHMETQTNLATCYLKLGNLALAKKHYLSALEISPTDTQILFNLGVINAQQGQLDNAIQYYQRAINLNPDFFAAHNNLGVAFLAKQHAPFALHHFKEALRLQPDNAAIRYTVESLAQNKNLSAAPKEYIQFLFDSYADHYEPHLVNALDYQVPKLLYEATLKIITPSSHSLDILDLGCGTGLCGVQFQAMAKSLVGIDLSQKMLDLAAQKNIYTTLLKTDIITALSNPEKVYDLILAGDVLVYIGDLKNIFAKAKDSLRHNGLFIFNTEINNDVAFKMNQSGRFGHQKKYIDDLTKQYDFKIKYYATVITRTQNNMPVYGHLYVLQINK